MKYLKRVQVVGLSSLIALLVGCVAQQESVHVIEMKNIVEMNEQQEEQERRDNIMNETMRLEHEYGDGIYVEDYTEIQTKLDEQCNFYLKEKAEGLDVSPYWMKGHVVLTNRGYKEAKDNDYDFDWIVENRKEILKEVRIENYTFADALDEMDRVSYKYFDAIEEKLADQLDFIPVYMVGLFDNENLEKFELNDLENLKNAAERIRFLEESNLVDSYRIQPYKGKSSVYGVTCDNPKKNLKDIYVELRKRYGTEFQMPVEALQEHLNWKNPTHDITFCPKFNPDLRFVYDYGKDKFSSVMAQYLLSVKIEDALKKEGLEDDIAYFIGDAYMGETFNLDAEFDPENPMEYLKTHSVGADVGFYYLIPPGEGVDSEKILNFLLAYSKDITENQQIMNYVIPYEIEENRKETLLKLFKEAKFSENYFRDDHLGEGIIIIRNDSECFKYLDVYANKKNYLYCTTGNLSRKTSLEEFEETCKQSSIWY